METRLDQGPTSPSGPIANPVDHFAHLPAYVRKFIESLDEEDIEALEDLLLSYKRARTIGWFLKWLVAIAASTFMATVALGEAFQKAATAIQSWWGK
jgi:hypothetical protein